MAKLLMFDKEICGIYFKNFTVTIEITIDPTTKCHITFHTRLHRFSQQAMDESLRKVRYLFPEWAVDLNNLWDIPIEIAMHKGDATYALNNPTDFIKVKAIRALGYVSTKTSLAERVLRKYMIEQIGDEEVDLPQNVSEIFIKHTY